MVDISFSWTVQDLKNFDNTTLRVVTSLYWQDCLSNEAWYPEYAEDASLVQSGDVLALICCDKHAFGVVCSKDDSIRVAWVNKDVVLDTLPMGRKYTMKELNEDIVREIQKTTNRFLR